MSTMNRSSALDLKSPLERGGGMLLPMGSVALKIGEEWSVELRERALSSRSLRSREDENSLHCLFLSLHLVLSMDFSENGEPITDNRSYNLQSLQVQDAIIFVRC